MCSPELEQKEARARLDHVAFQNPLRRMPAIQHVAALDEGISCGPEGTEPVGVRVRRALRQRFQGQQVQSLNRPVAHRRNARRPLTVPVVLRDVNPSERKCAIAPAKQGANRAGLALRRGPRDVIHSGSLATMILSDPADGKQLAARRVGQQPLQPSCAAPVAVPYRLRYESLQSPSRPVYFGPVDTVPRHHIGKMCPYQPPR